MVRLQVFIILVILCSGCESSDRGATDPPDRVEWSTEVEARIGSVDDPDQSLSPQGLQVLIGPNEEVVVSQPMDATVRIFDGEGRFQRTIGGRGEGPGEFSGLTHIGLFGDTLYANEPGRISFFRLEGQFLGARTLLSDVIRLEGATYAPFAPQKFIPLQDGTAMVEPGVMVAASPPDSPGVTEGSLRTPLLHTDSLSAVLDTIVWAHPEDVTLSMTEGGDLFSFLVPFRDRPLVEMAPDGSGVVVVDRSLPTSPDEATYQVSLLGPDGDTVFVQDVPYAPRGLDDQDVRQVLERTEVLSRDPDDRPSVSAMARELESAGLIPETAVSVTALAIGQDGSNWLRREESSQDSVVWEVLDGRGVRQGSVALPPEQRVVAAKDNRVAVLEQDELDVPYVVLYRIIKD